MAAARALLKLLLALGYGGFQRRVVGLAPHGPVDVVGCVLGPTQAAKQAAGRLQQAARYADGIGLKPRHVAVAALVAVKLELETLVGGQVVVVGNELNQATHSAGERKK